MRDFGVIFRRIAATVLLGFAFYLLARARIIKYIIPLSAGLFSALIYCRKNYYIISLSYVIAYLLANMNYLGLISSLTLIAVFGIAKLVHHKLAVPMRIPFVTVYCAAAQLPECILQIVFNGRIVVAIASVAQSAIFCVLCCYACYACTVRMRSGKFSYDEKAGIFAIIAAVSLGLSTISLWQFMPYYIFLGAIVLISALYMRRLAGIGASVAYALGAAIQFRSLESVGAVLLIWAAAVCFSSLNKWLSALSEMGVFVLCGYIFKCFPSFGWRNMLLFAIGLTGVVLLTKSTARRIKSTLSPDTDSALKYALTRERDIIFNKINGMSNIFLDMSRAFGKEISVDTEYEKAICEDLERKVCKGCDKRESCVNLCERDNHIFLPMVRRALSGCVPVQDDLPLFVVSKCDRLSDLTQCCAEEAAKADGAALRRADMSRGSAAVASQTESVGKLLADLVTDLGRGGASDEVLAAAIGDELGYNNIACRNVAVLGREDGRQISLSLRRGDEDKKALVRSVSRLAGSKMCITDLSDERDGYVNVLMSRAPDFDVIYGVASAVKSGEEAAGDTVSLARLMRDRVSCILCDGMGSGRAAEKESLLTLRSVEGFYKAGFDDNAVLALINRYLSARGSEKFCALDICIIDLTDGSAQFVKLGGVESYIIHSNGIEVVSGSALPIGILDEVKPYVKKVKLRDGDIVVMVSDGVIDALTPQGAEYIIRSVAGGNPQRLSDGLLASAIKNGAGDDTTVLAVKIFNNRD